MICTAIICSLISSPRYSDVWLMSGDADCAQTGGEMSPLKFSVCILFSFNEMKLLICGFFLFSCLVWLNGRFGTRFLKFIVNIYILHSTKIVILAFALNNIQELFETGFAFENKTLRDGGFSHLFLSLCEGKVSLYDAVQKAAQACSICLGCSARV